MNYMGWEVSFILSRKTSEDKGKSPQHGHFSERDIKLQSLKLRPNQEDKVRFPRAVSQANATATSAQFGLCYLLSDLLLGAVSSRIVDALR